MSSCIFCKIVSDESPSQTVYHDDLVTGFRDAHPIASTHILIIPNQHIASVNELEDRDAPLVGHMFVVARQLAAREGIADDGYRLIVNTGGHGGQTVFHLHLHLIGGRRTHFLVR
jgi:histidine triad (HIT) family protein